MLFTRRKPLIWIARKSQQAAELNCDARAVGAFPDERWSYSRALVDAWSVRCNPP
ncbi:MAG: beta-lactamase regulating signal transducer with metallopeptidase domain [Candidatus Paceibacteria bacterium]